MIAEIVVRAPERSDARAMGEIWFEGELASLRESYPGREPERWFSLPSIEWCEGYWRDVIASPDGTVIVAEREGRVVGFATAGAPERRSEGWGQLHSLYVHPDAWATGVGSSLLERCEAWLRLEGYATAFLWAVRGNLRSRSFYERRAWAADGATMEAQNGLPLVRYVRSL